MAGTQASRQRLYRELGELLSQEAMDELMDVIPPDGWGQVAHRQDITNLEYSLRAEMAEVRGELRTVMADLRGEFRTEMADLRADFTSAMRPSATPGWTGGASSGCTGVLTAPVLP